MLELTEMKIKKLMPVDAESRRLIDWMEKGNIELLAYDFELLLMGVLSVLFDFFCRCIRCLTKEIPEDTSILCVRSSGWTHD